MLTLNLSLKSGETIQVFWKAKANSHPDTVQMLFDTFPKKVAIAFSSKWRAGFPAVNLTNLEDLRKSGANKQIVVIGATMENSKEMLNWMLKCCEGKGLVDIPPRPTMVYTYLHKVRLWADENGIDYLCSQTLKAKNRIAATQIPSEDVQALWNTYPDNAPLRQLLTDHCGIRFWEKTFEKKTYPAYKALREELPEFGQAINDFCKAKYDAGVEARKEARAEENKAYWAERKKEAKLNRSNRNSGYRRGGQGKDTKAAEEKGEPEPENVVLHLDVVRKGTKKQPAYGKLPLGEIGLRRRSSPVPIRQLRVVSGNCRSGMTRMGHPLHRLLGT